MAQLVGRNGRFHNLSRWCENITFARAIGISTLVFRIRVGSHLEERVYPS